MHLASTDINFIRYINTMKLQDIVRIEHLRNCSFELTLLYATFDCKIVHRYNITEGRRNEQERQSFINYPYHIYNLIRRFRHQ